MTIKIYPSLMQGEPIEQHEYHGGSIGAWLESHGIEFSNLSAQPIQVSVDGVALPVEAWKTTIIQATHEVDVRILPHGGVFNALSSIIRKLDPALNWFLKGMSPKTANNNQQSGQKLEAVEASANEAKLGAVVPELAGRFRRFPDYLVPPRRYFASPREQWLEFLCCIGPGQYLVADADVKVGETPFSSLGADAQYGIYAPGTDLAAVAGHEHWHTVDEVGATSSGTAGLELSVEYSSNINPTAASYQFNGGSISVNPVDGRFPEAWGVGTVLDIRLPQAYEITQEGDPEAGFYNRINGNFREISPTPGQAIRASGDITGQYFVSERSIDENGDGWITLTQGEGVIGDLPLGPMSIAFYINGRRYRLTSSSDQAVTIEAISEGAAVGGWAGFPVVTSSTVSISVDSSTIYGDWTSMFRACPPAERTDTFELDFFFPGGLAYIEDDGDLSGRSVTVEIQYRDATIGGAFASAYRTYSQATLDQIGFTERITLANALPEVRIRRVGSQDTSTQLQDKIQWYGLRSRLATRTIYPNWTTMSIRLRGGGRLGAQSENQINVVATRVLPTLQAGGIWGAATPTRDISAFVKYIATTIGYTDADLDMEELQRLHAVWASRGETLDHVFDETTVRDALSLALGAGMAELTISDGRIKPVRDDVRTQFEQGYSPQNMTGPLRRAFRSPRPGDADGVEVEFVNGETWAKDVVRCLLPGDQGFKIQRIKADGVTDRTRAYRIGMRARRRLRYRNWEYSFMTELDSLNSDYLSYVPLVDDIPGYGKSAILEAIYQSGSLAVLQVSEPLTWEAGKTHVVAYRKPDGTLAGPFLAQPGADAFSILADIPQPWPVVTLKQEPPHVYFGTSTAWCFPALITDIRPGGNDGASVAAENYDGRVYASDNDFPPT